MIPSLKLALRNLAKYKLQTLISVCGLAIGFVCFALSVSWIQYETHYDADTPEVGRICIPYELTCESQISNYQTHFQLDNWVNLVKSEPEIESISLTYRMSTDVSSGDRTCYNVRGLWADSAFVEIMHPELIAGTWNFLENENQIAISDRLAQQLFETTDVLGKTLNLNGTERTIEAVLAYVEHSNFSFDFLANDRWFKNVKFGEPLIKLEKGVDIKTFEKKLQQKEPVPIYGGLLMEKFDDVHLCPLTELHYAFSNRDNKVEFTYLRLFAVCGLLVILCALFNYLSVFVVRINLRSREIALRKACGASRRQIIGLFVMEYSLMTLMAVAVSYGLFALVRTPFLDLTGIEGHLEATLLLYWVGVWGITCLLLTLFTGYYTRHLVGRWNHHIHKAALSLQLVISLLMFFCISVLIKQIDFLKHTDLGWERNTIAYLRIFDGDADAIAQQVELLPTVEKVVKKTEPLGFPGGSASCGGYRWEGMEEDKKAVRLEVIENGNEIFSLYRMHLLEGRLPKTGSVDEVMVNEEMVRRNGIEHPVGKMLYDVYGKDFRIVGMVQDAFIKSPTESAVPMLFKPQQEAVITDNMIVQYQEGQWVNLQKQLKEMMDKQFPGASTHLRNTTDYYDELLYSEQLLSRLLSIVAAVCMAISAFGVFSMISLSCERRQKEIAIRKVNGAKRWNIYHIFAKEYLWQLVIASAIAFPMGYAIMRQWLDNYVKQTAISWWIYAGIFATTAFIVFGCIAWRIWKVARVNPAEVIKYD